MSRPLLPALLLTSATSPGSAAPVDILPRIYADGVFRSAVALPAAQLPKGSRGVQLQPGSYGGEWFLTLSGPKGVTGAHLTYAGNSFSPNVRAVARLSARLSGTLAAGCFGLGADRLGELKVWVEAQVGSAGERTLNTERSFGPLRVQLLIQQREGEKADVDVLLARSGTPGSAAWTATCTR